MDRPLGSCPFAGTRPAMIFCTQCGDTRTLEPRSDTGEDRVSSVAMRSDNRAR